MADGYPGLIGKWMSGEIMTGCDRAGERATGEVVGGSNCHPLGTLALLVDGAVVYVTGARLRVEERPRLPRPEPTSLPRGVRVEIDKRGADS